MQPSALCVQHACLPGPVQGRLSAEVELQAKRMRDRQAEVAELAKRQPGIGMHFAGLPTEAEVAEFGMKARAKR